MTRDNSSPPLGAGAIPSPPRPLGWILPVTIVASVIGLIAMLALPVLLGAGRALDDHGSGSGLGLGLGLGSRTYSDPKHRVSVTLPDAWYDDTQPDAGTDVDRGKEPGYRIPDIEAESPSGTTYLSLLVFDHDLTAAAREHLDYVDGVCADLGCIRRGSVDTLQIDGHQAYQQVITHPADPDIGTTQTMVTTIRTPHLLTVIEGEFDEGDADGLAELRTAVATTRIQD